MKSKRKRPATAAATQGLAPKVEWLTDAETQDIIRNFAKTRGDKGFSADELTALLNECQQIRIGANFLEQILCGNIACDWNGKKMVLGLGHNLKPNA